MFEQIHDRKLKLYQRVEKETTFNGNWGAVVVAIVGIIIFVFIILVAVFGQ